MDGCDMRFDESDIQIRQTKYFILKILPQGNYLAQE
jgi:hypothetical protein